MMPYPSPGVEPDALARIAQGGDLAERIGECEHPIWMRGQSLLVDADTGQILSDQTVGARSIAVRCRSRRVSQCPSCSALYKLDAYHLVAAGLRGGKDTPPQVSDRPRLFVTLTAPSFGQVHRGPDRDGTPKRCHPYGDGSGCGLWHLPADPAIGTPLDAVGYDYVGQVMFNAHAGMLLSLIHI